MRRVVNCVVSVSEGVGFRIRPAVFVKECGARVDGHVIEIQISRPLSVKEIVELARSVSREVMRHVMRGIRLSVVGVTGRMPVVLAFMLAHSLAHLVEAVAVFDPKIPGYVVTINHGTRVSEGDILREVEMK